MFALYHMRSPANKRSLETQKGGKLIPARPIGWNGLSIQVVTLPVPPDEIPARWDQISPRDGWSRSYSNIQCYSQHGDFAPCYNDSVLEIDEYGRDHPSWDEFWFHRAGISSGGTWSVATCVDKPIQPIGRAGMSFWFLKTFFCGAPHIMRTLP